MWPISGEYDIVSQSGELNNSQINIINPIPTFGTNNTHSNDD